MDHTGSAVWLCRCECGSEIELNGRKLRVNISCGCARKKTEQSMAIRKGRGKPEYNAKRRERRIELIKLRQENGFEGYVHGDRLTYRAGCRCDDCRRSAFAHAKKVKEELRTGEKRKCGTYVSYKAGCRCVDCSAVARFCSIKKRYGIEREQVWSLLSRMCYSCGICGLQLDDNWMIDHCHKTNRVRGILCRKCNSGLGQFGDDVSRIKRAAEYIRRFLAGDRYSEAMSKKKTSGHQETIFGILGGVQEEFWDNAD